jgi:hypothetical protein
VTQHGSFPGRPRGRRARQDGDVPEWQGQDATPEDQREFPDLSPIRPREARAGDGRTQGDQGGYPDSGYPGRYPQGGQDQVGPGPGGGPYGPGRYSPHQYGSGQYGSGQYGTGAQYGAGQYGGGGYQGGYGDPAQPAPSAPSPQPPAPASETRAPRAERSTLQVDEETPSWAEPDSVEAFSERWHRRGLDSRDERREGRRKRRRLLIAGGVVLALAVGATIYLLSGGPGAANLGFGSFVTNFLPGELQQVPDPCSSVPAATLNQYMPGTLKQAAPPLNSGANTECTWTLDNAPTYRVLQVQLQAYSPSGLASGNGSATFAAEDAYQSSENGYTSPGPKSGQPKASVTDLFGMPGGDDTSAFQATQVFNRGGATTDVANVLVRYRNVIITVVVDGLDQTSGGKKYGPVSMSDLTAAATTVAKEMAAQIAK